MPEGEEVEEADIGKGGRGVAGGSLGGCDPTRLFDRSLREEEMDPERVKWTACPRRVALRGITGRGPSVSLSVDSCGGLAVSGLKELVLCDSLAVFLRKESGLGGLLRDEPGADIASAIPLLRAGETLSIEAGIWRSGPAEGPVRVTR